MSVLHPTPVSTGKFTWLCEENLLVAEDSDLPRPSRVYDDACDEGYTLISHETGREVVVAMSHVEKRDGDILYWEFEAITQSGRALFPGKVQVFND